ncbi:MAG: outer membrane beta-barrel protein [Candidatus Thiodiazotropha sp. (ex Monitilora ramsayi)]|nr:outer membrane beta-barrel protein [Candidatus Thiodiazotropha sp. (ex Monitilora ramsayi)]
MRAPPFAIFILILILAILNVLAAYAAEAGVSTTNVVDEKKLPGFYTDDFRILPELEVSGYYDDNIYATKRAKESDLVSVVSPSVRIDSLWQRHTLDFSGGASIGRYLDISAENYEDLWLDLDAEYDISEESQVFAGAGLSRNHESRDSKESSEQRIDEPTTYDAQRFQFGLNRMLGRTVLKIGATHEMLDYDNVGTLFNDDRDRTVRGLGLRLSRAITSKSQLFVQGVLNQRHYDEPQDKDGFERDSDGYKTAVGLIQAYDGGHQLEAYIGYLAQDYDDPRFSRVSEANYGFDLLWYPSAKTKVTAALDRSLNETTETGSSGYLYTGIDLQIDQKLSTNVLGFLNYNYGLAEFQDVGREDSTQTLNLGLKYFMSTKLMLSGSYSYINNDSNDLGLVGSARETYDYERNLFFLTLKVRLTP